MDILFDKEGILQKCLCMHMHRCICNVIHCVMPCNSNKAWKNLSAPQPGKSHEIQCARTTKYYLVFKKEQKSKNKDTENVCDTLASEKERLQNDRIYVKNMSTRSKQK